MEKKSLKYYGAFLLIVASAVVYLLSLQQPKSEPAQPARVTHPETEVVTGETTTPQTAVTEKQNFDAFGGLEKESDKINTFEDLLN